MVSNKNFVREEYKRRVTLKSRPDKNLFLVEVMELTESDSGVYACGTGLNTDRGKTQQVTLNVHSGRCPPGGGLGNCATQEGWDNHQALAVLRIHIIALLASPTNNNRDFCS